MQSPAITMPHRHTVRYETDSLVLEFEVEPLTDGIVLYRADPNLIKGSQSNLDDETQVVEDWLRNKFTNVEIE